jgi:cytochrome c oxidase accessory protein FixG
MKNDTNIYKSIYTDEDSYRDSIATVDKQGKRIWIYPKKPSGKFFNYRQVVGYFLLLILFTLPIIRWNDNPLFLLNILERKFILMGFVFFPQDFHLFVFAMLTFIIFIILFTLIFGRLFCGWTCPQTVFMELVFRRIEYAIEGDYTAQKKLNAAPWTAEKIIKKGIKHFIFFMLSFIIANIFLSYIIGYKEVFKIATDPISNHLSGFIAIVVFSYVFYGVFAFLREQVCTTICPYGRLQGVLLDKNSIVITYDSIRGEPRGKLKKQDEAHLSLAPMGDCVDCGLCIKVCPTGIDIRNGTQLECVNCTACIDACDEVMLKVNKPTNLIKYDSAEGLKTGQNKLWTTRTSIYSTVLAVLIGLNIFLLSSREDIEAIILKSPGTTYQIDKENNVSNLFTYELINKSGKDQEINFSTADPKFIIEVIGNTNKIAIKKDEFKRGALLIKTNQNNLTKWATEIKVHLKSEEEEVDKKIKFIGPYK